MSDTPAQTTEEPSPLPECPTCGNPVTSVTVRGPTEGTAHPCGCHLWPVALENPRLD
ncbi:hypothetical protein [Natronorubrum sp. FCH18a]|uniref:hypothetical protein n=1 Tax=Natronorubrum sp. FCH18a TaxID=3447018 RepID=UPI003F517D8E